MNKLRTYQLVCFVFFLCMALLTAVVASLIGDVKARDQQIAELRVKMVSEWQYHAYTAVKARGWLVDGGVVENAGDITPEILGYALNPCYLTSAGNWDRHDTKRCGLFTPGSVPVMFVPIKIEFAESWPRWRGHDCQKADREVRLRFFI